MPARINRNVHLQQVTRNLSLHFDKATRQIEQLASGHRVNRASDDPASLALADGIKSEIRTLAEGNRNIQQSIHMLQVADGALSHISDMVLRMRNLAVQGASSTYTDSDRQNLNSEFMALRAEIDRIAEVTRFNDIPLLNEEHVFTIQAGSTDASNDVSRITIRDMRASGLTLELGELRIGTLRDAQEIMSRLQRAHETVIEERNHIAAFQQRLEFSVDTGLNVIEKMRSSEADIRDTDLVRATSDLNRSQILSQTAASFATDADVDIERILSLLQ